MSTSIRTAAGLALAAAGVLALAGTAAAGAKHPQPASPAGAAAAGKPAPAEPAVVPDAPRKFTIVQSGDLGAPTGEQTRGQVQCPAGTVVLGGGAFVASTSTRASINSSFPDSNAWVVDLDNASGAATTFDVLATCARQPRGYAIVRSAEVSNPSGSQATAIATCPRGTKALGGGGLSSSNALFANINSTVPQTAGWRVDENNATAFDETVSAFVVCGKEKGYTVVQGAQSPDPPNSQAESDASCPAGDVPIGGGVFSNSSSVGVTVNETGPTPFGWISFINNASGVASSGETFVVCAA